MQQTQTLLDRIVEHYDQLKYALLEAQTFDPGHFGFPPVYYDIMETDRTRIEAFRRAFEHYDFRGKTVCEAGVGRLALSRLFLPKVKKAYLIENNPHLFAYLEKEIAKNGWASKVELIFGDARSVELPETIDFAVAEMMSVFCANELQVQVFQHLRKFLKPEGRLLPEKIVNTVQLVRADFEHGHQHYPIFLTRHLPECLSLEKRVNTLDLYSVNKTSVSKQMTIKPLLSGTANAVLLRSWVQIAEGCNFTGTDSLMPPTVCKLRKEARLMVGEPLQLKMRFEYGASLDEADFEIGLV